MYEVRAGEDMFGSELIVSSCDSLFNTIIQMLTYLVGGCAGRFQLPEYLHLKLPTQPCHLFR